MKFPHVLVGLERVARWSTCAIFTVGPITILPLSAFSFPVIKCETSVDFPRRWRR